MKSYAKNKHKIRSHTKNKRKIRSHAKNKHKIPSHDKNKHKIRSHDKNKHKISKKVKIKLNKIMALNSKIQHGVGRNRVETFHMARPTVFLPAKVSISFGF